MGPVGSEEKSIGRNGLGDGFDSLNDSVGVTTTRFPLLDPKKLSYRESKGDR
jgi:hypothetical protein